MGEDLPRDVLPHDAVIYICTLNDDVIDMDMFERFEKKPWEKGRKSGPDVGYLGEYVIAVSAVLSGSWNSV